MYFPNLTLHALYAYIETHLFASE